MMMREPLKPLATDGEWQGKMVRNVVGNVHAHIRTGHAHPVVEIVAPNTIAEFNRAEAVVPLINALPDDSSYKVRPRYVAALTNVVQGYRDDNGIAVLDELASVLTALLRPA